LASLLHRRRSTEVYQTLHVGPSPGLVHYITLHQLNYIFGRSCRLPEFCQVQNSLCVQVLRSHILPALLHGTRAAGVSQTAAFSRRRHLYSAGRPSRWASALHILVLLLTICTCWWLRHVLCVCISTLCTLCTIYIMHKVLVDGWQLSGGIATRAARRALPSRQYGLWVKCGPAGMRARAVGRKVRAAVPLCVVGEPGPHLTQCRLQYHTSVPSGILIHPAAWP